MQMGQVPVMFTPDAPVNDVSANTLPTDADMATMMPAEMLPDRPNIFANPQTWIFIGAALVVWWAMSPRRR